MCVRKTEAEEERKGRDDETRRIDAMRVADDDCGVCGLTTAPYQIRYMLQY